MRSLIGGSKARNLDIGVLSSLGPRDVPLCDRLAVGGVGGEGRGGERKEEHLQISV